MSCIYNRHRGKLNGAMSSRALTNSPGKYTGMDNGWTLALLQPVIIEFDKSIVEFPNIKRVPDS